jgi:hypothetical protein
MLRTVRSAELECIRYRGEDADVLRRLAEGGRAHLSDIHISGIERVSYDRVTFDVVDALDETLSPKQLAELFQKYLRSVGSEYLSHKFTRLTDSPTGASFSYSWFEDNFHAVDFFLLRLPDCRWLVVSDMSFMVHDWLTYGDRFGNIRWYTEQQWNTSRDWQETPW